jgi:hypothetical protein
MVAVVKPLFSLFSLFVVLAHIKAANGDFFGGLPDKIKGGRTRPKAA